MVEVPFGIAGGLHFFDGSIWMMIFPFYGSIPSDDGVAYIVFSFEFINPRPTPFGIQNQQPNPQDCEDNTKNCEEYFGQHSDLTNPRPN